VARLLLGRAGLGNDAALGLVHVGFLVVLWDVKIGQQHDGI
jgi:hypothetical protein